MRPKTPNQEGILPRAARLAMAARLAHVARAALRAQLLLQLAQRRLHAPAVPATARHARVIC